MAEASSLERLLRRDRLVTAAALAVLCAAAWAYVIMGAGFGTAAWRMTSLGVPGAAAEAGAMAMAAAPQRSAGVAPVRMLLTILMWWSMMIAMMAPSAAPMVLLYARVARKARDPALERTGWFVAGYLATWLAFSAAAALMQQQFTRAAWILPGMLNAQSRGFAAAVLLLAGLYQLSPMHEVCLTHCRSPAAFLSRHYRPGRGGALRLGLVHGAYCVACCWLLMALLFVGGVMNLIWIAALTLIVVAEKTLPGGRWIARGTGLVLFAASLLVGFH